MKPSSNVAGVEYDGQKKELSVKFKSGGHYIYEGVPPEIFAGLDHASSAGEYLSTHIKGKFKWRVGSTLASSHQKARK